MSLRLWHQSGGPLASMGAYGDALKRHVAAVVSPGTEVVFHGLDPRSYAGRPPAEVFKYAWPRHLILSQIVENCIQAEKEGFDAVAIAAYNDPFVREARSMVDIPVVSMAETAMLVACSVAKRFALITLTPENVWRLREIVDRHGLGSRVSGILALEPRTTERELMAGFADPAPVIDIFERSARRAIAEGADLVIPAEGVLNEVLFAQRCHRIDDVPVLDCVGATFCHAEMMVRLQRSTGLSVGRRWEHARPDDALMNDIRQANLGKN